MRRIKKILRAIPVIGLAAVGLAVYMPGFGQADTTSGPSLVISQLKITSSNGQFITLYNPTNGALNMSNYQLEYFNNYDLTKATSSKLIALTGTLPPHSYFMVSDGSLLLCYQLTVDSVSLGLSSMAGFVEVVGFGQASPGGPITPTQQDYVGWSKTAALGAQTLPTNVNAFLQRQPLDSSNNPSVTTAGAGSWQTVQPDASNACALVNGTTNTATPMSSGDLLPGVEPAATIQSLATAPAAATVPTLPAADIGLMAPTVTEILPNPTGTGNDATDEFIELYNPNPVAFDLTGFVLQSGTTSLHNATLANGTSIPPQSFKALYSSTTGLSLSNSGGEVKLIDPLTRILSTTAVYDTAKDGQSWALANGKWYWTTTLTPGASNVINQPNVAKTSTAKTPSKTSSSVKGASTVAGKAGTLAAEPTGDTTRPIHDWVLAAIGGVAVLYGAYEYRADLANRLHQLRRHPATGRRAWLTAPWRRSNRASR